MCSSDLAPQDDRLEIEISPCDPRLTILDVQWIISSRPINSGCEVEMARFVWRDMPRWIYERAPT